MSNNHRIIKRLMMPKNHLIILESVYKNTRFPNIMLKHILANYLGIDVIKIKKWFQNRRYKEKTYIQIDEFNNKHLIINNDKINPIYEEIGIFEQDDLLKIIFKDLWYDVSHLFEK